MLALVVFTSGGIGIYHLCTKDQRDLHDSIVNKRIVIDVGEIILEIKRERNVLRKLGVDDGCGLLFRSTSTYRKLSNSSTLGLLNEIDKAILQEGIRERY